MVSVPYGIDDPSWIWKLKPSKPLSVRGVRSSSKVDIVVALRLLV